MIIRCPKFNGVYGHVWNCRWNHWGEPTGSPKAAGTGGDFNNQSEVLIHHNIFPPCVNGDAHNWGNYLIPPAIWTVSNPSTYAMTNDSGGLCRIQTRTLLDWSTLPAGQVTNWYHGTGTNLGDGNSTANGVAIGNHFTRTDPTWLPMPIPSISRPTRPPWSR